MEKQTARDPVFDVMKGIGIILMLIGHIPPGDQVYHFIYSFHMPLFFIVAGLFANTIHSDKDWLLMLRKDALRLILPVVITMVFVILLSPLHYVTDKNFNYVVCEVLSLFWSGDVLDTKWGVLNSPMWFLISLFWTRVLFRCVEFIGWRQHKRHDEIVLLMSIGLAYLAVVLHGFLPFPTPLGILKGITALSFYSIGWYVKKHKIPMTILCVLVLFWLLALRYGGIDMYKYRYSCFPIDVLGAAGATWLIYLLCKGICRVAPKTSVLLQWFGVNSLLIFCVHCFDRRTYFVKAVKSVIELVFNTEIVGYSSVILHYSIEMIMVVAIAFIPLFKRIYGARRLKEIIN